MEIEITVGGISYIAEVDLEENYVSGVESVEVYDGEGNTFHIDMSQEQLKEFHERYEDELNEAYRNHQIAQAELAAEERWERENER